jgi:hypothetical protein
MQRNIVQLEFYHDSPIGSGGSVKDDPERFAKDVMELNTFRPAVGARGL